MKKQHPRRHRLWLDQGKKCCYCQAGIAYTSATIEHKVPRGEGGTDMLDNIAVACCSCNAVMNRLFCSLGRKNKRAIIRAIRLGKLPIIKGDVVSATFEFVRKKKRVAPFARSRGPRPREIGRAHV